MSLLQGQTELCFVLDTGTGGSPEIDTVQFSSDFKPNGVCNDVITALSTWRCLLRY